LALVLRSWGSSKSRIEQLLVGGKSRVDGGEGGIAPNDGSAECCYLGTQRGGFGFGLLGAVERD
jgi:hypothetical protein